MIEARERGKLGISEHFERKLRRKDGSTLWVSLSATPIMDDQNRFIGFFSMFTDITSRKLAEENMAATQAKLQDAMDLAQIVYWEVDLATGDFIFNDSFYAFYATDAEREGGYRMSRGEYAKRFIYPDDLWLFAQAAERRRLNTERDFVTDIEHRVVRRDGEVRHILARIRVESDAEGHVTKHYGSNQDITQRKQAEEALRKTEEQYRRIVDTTSEGIWTANNDFFITYTNKRMAEILGYEPNELIGKNIRFFAFEDDVRDVVYKLERRKQGISEQYERRYRRKDGSTVWVHVSATPTYDAEGRVMGSFAMFTDITARKYAEEEKALLESQLRQSQKLEAIGTLAGGVAHDFNNILTAIVGFSSLARMELTEDDPKTAYIEQVLSAAEKASNLTQSLLAFSRKQKIDPKPHRINDIIKDTTKLLKRLLTEDISLNIELDPANPVILADITQVDQILINLAINARDAMPKGGVLSIRMTTVTLGDEFIKSHDLGQVGEYALLSVSDNGTGMDEITKEHIFEPFFTTKEMGRGTGLGLSTVYGIVKQHNGNINVDSTLNKGTTFRIYFPVVQLREQKVSDTLMADIQRGSETILVAEDDPGVRSFIVDILHRYGYTTIEAADGQKALRQYADNQDRIDLVVCDVVMPKMNGKEMYDRIKITNPNIRALFISGYTQDVVLDRGIEDSTVDFIAKPIRPKEFLKKVRGVLDR